MRPPRDLMRRQLFRRGSNRRNRRPRPRPHHLSRSFRHNPPIWVLFLRPSYPMRFAQTPFHGKVRKSVACLPWGIRVRAKWNAKLLRRLLRPHLLPWHPHRVRLHSCLPRQRRGPSLAPHLSQLCLLPHQLLMLHKVASQACGRDSRTQPNKCLIVCR